MTQNKSQTLGNVNILDVITLTHWYKLTTEIHSISLITSKIRNFSNFNQIIVRFTTLSVSKGESTLTAGVHWSTKQAVPRQISITSRVPSSLTPSEICLSDISVRTVGLSTDNRTSLSCFDIFLFLLR